MKFLILAATLVSLSTYANDLSQREASTWSEEIDNICGDTWCEGEFNWSFYDAKCDFESGTCTMEMILMESIYDSEQSYIAEIRSYPGVDVDRDYMDEEVNVYYGTCTMKGMTSISDVLNASKNSYSEKSYDMISNCVTELEEEYYQLQDKAFVLSRLKTCSKEITASNYEADILDSSTYGRKFYDEKKEFENLKEYVSRIHKKEMVYDNSLDQIYFAKEKENPACMAALNEIKDEYFVLAFKLSNSWQNKDMSVRLTRKRSWRDQDSINLTLKK